MAWVRIHDGVMTNAKVASLSDAGFRLWVLGLCYCQTALTDGLIPRAALRQMGARPSTVRELTVSKLPGRAPLWELHDLGFLVHHYGQWNDERAEVLRKRERGRQRVEKFRAERGRYNALQAGGVTHNEHVFPPRHMSGSGSSSSVPVGGTHPPERGNALRPRIVLDPAESVLWFDQIYAAYPNKERKVAANEAWVLLGPDLATAQAILADIQHRKQNGWLKLERRFIPHLTRFLAERQWEDTPEPSAIYEETDGNPHLWTCGTCGEIHEGTSAQVGTCLKAPAAARGQR